MFVCFACCDCLVFSLFPFVIGLYLVAIDDSYVGCFEFVGFCADGLLVVQCYLLVGCLLTLLIWVAVLLL